METFTFLNRTSNRLILARIARDPQRANLIYPTGLINPQITSGSFVQQETESLGICCITRLPKGYFSFPRNNLGTNDSRWST